MSTGVPLGYFYDIQNCPFPPNKDPIDCVQLLREKFGAKGSEQEFVVACDVRKEKPEIIEALDYIPLLTVPHVSSARKESADKLLEIYLNNFATSHRDEKGTIVLITSDEGFRSQIADLRYKKHFDVILLHGYNVTPQFLKFPNEHYNFYELLDELPDVKADAKPKFSLIKAYLLPVPHGSYPQKFSKRDCEIRLNQIFRCRSVDYNPQRMSASLLFNDMNEADKVRNKTSEDVYGHPVKLVYPECKSWRESGECVNRDSCEYFHFADAKGVGPQESIEDLVRPQIDARSDVSGNSEPESSNGIIKRVECKYYRGTGCDKPDDICKFIHNPVNKGADLQFLDCKYGERCVKYVMGTGCPFRHAEPPPRLFSDGIGVPKLVGDADKHTSDVSALTDRFAAVAASKRSADASLERSSSPSTYAFSSPSSIFAQPRSQQLSLLQSKSLYVGLLSKSATQEQLVEEGKKLSGFANVALRIQPDGTRYAFFNFNTPEATKDAKDKLEELKAEHLKDENEDIFLSLTAIRFQEPKAVNYESEDISNPTRCKVVYVGSLNTNVTQKALNTIGATKLVEYGWNGAFLKQDHKFGSYYAFFNFNTPDGAARAKLKLIQLKKEELRQQTQSIFTMFSKIDYPDAPRQH